METKKEKILNIIIKDKEIDSFKEVIKKCITENKKIGFKDRVFNKEEIDLIENINAAIID